MKFELGSGTMGTLCVCNTIAVGQSKKRSFEEDDTPDLVKKKLRTDQILEEDSNQHLKEEIERLKGELSQRDKEISNLNKIIAALTRKQGL